MLVSPAEPPFLRALGPSSLTPERLGVDFLLPAYTLGPAGVQRKELGDLVSSVRDGRLAREVAQASALNIKVLLVEGEARWTRDGMLMAPFGQWTRAQHDGVVWSMQVHGWWVGTTASIEETKEWLSRFAKWLMKKGHNGVASRVTPKPGMWGTKGSKEWGVHLLQGLEGIGYERAEGIWEMFQGVPLAWTVGVDDLEQVEGIGPKTARRIWEALGGVDGR